jgi:cell division protein FtsL
MKKAGLFLTVLVGITITLSLAQIAVSNAFSTSGIALGEMQNKIAQLQNENMVLRTQVFTLSSYTHIASSASQMGFVPSQSQIVLGNSKPLAIRQ